MRTKMWCLKNDAPTGGNAVPTELSASKELIGTVLAAATQHSHPAAFDGPQDGAAPAPVKTLLIDTSPAHGKIAVLATDLADAMAADHAAFFDLGLAASSNESHRPAPDADRDADTDDTSWADEAARLVSLAHWQVAASE